MCSSLALALVFVLHPFLSSWQVGKSRSKAAFMTYVDPSSLLHFSWYGYSTGWGAEGDWIFPDEEDTSSSSSSALSSSDSEAEEINAMEERRKRSSFRPFFGHFL
ncbi:hypothetical protein E2C01_101480 [Portunus trituberculatus]|uniref:Secreted protein n=1 Tax=Portunus trituberculatus TaxID=210409 RepID=A0A5B7KEV8_PORTR|nr:hypothetical protein [Portunus trituberculatus]